MWLVYALAGIGALTSLVMLGTLGWLITQSEPD
jgi:hypothetical protein